MTSAAGESRAPRCRPWRWRVHAETEGGVWYRAPPGIRERVRLPHLYTTSLDCTSYTIELLLFYIDSSYERAKSMVIQLESVRLNRPFSWLFRWMPIQLNEALSWSILWIPFSRMTARVSEWKPRELPFVTSRPWLWIGIWIEREAKNSTLTEYRPTPGPIKGRQNLSESVCVLDTRRSTPTVKCATGLNYELYILG